MKYTLTLLFTWWSLIALTQTLPAPLAMDGNSCGAGNVVLSATSTVNDPDLVFDWYRSADGGLQLLGSIEASTGESQLITPFVVSTETFFVGIRIGSLAGPLTSVRATIENEAFIEEMARVELCSQATLHSSSTFSDTDVLQFQWQTLTAQADGEATFDNLTTATSTLEDLITDELGFYRVIVTRSDGCQAFSSEVEVTNDRLAHATPLGGGQHCFTVGNVFTHQVTLSSEYQRDIATYLWEESIDGINFNTISTEQEVIVTKLGSIVTNTSVFYRLTVFEQNCSETSAIFNIDWTLNPIGTIAHTEPTIGTNDFFYCGTDAAAMRTLEAFSLNNVSVSWIRGVLLPGRSLNFIKNILRTLNLLDPANSELLEAFDVIGVGNTIILEQNQGGLIYALFTDTVTGCISYSNAIFADTAFPFSLAEGILANEAINLVCKGEGSISFDSYDQSVDTYFWQKSISGAFVEIGTEATLLLDATLEPVVGTYRLEVNKMGCLGQSAEFAVFESEPVEALIEATDGEEVSTDNFTICPGEELFLTTINSSNAYSYRWLTGVNATLGNDQTLLVTEAGSYFLELTNGACVDLSEEFVVMEDPIPSAVLTIDVSDSGLVICEPILLELQNPGSDTFQWYSSENNLIYQQIADETDSDYFISQPGYFFVEVTNSIGCSVVSDTLFVPAIVSAETNFESVAKICGSSGHALLMVESPIVSNAHVWLFSPDNVVPYTEATGSNNLTYYQAFEEGFYVLEVSSAVCSATSDPIDITLEQDAKNESFDATIEGVNSVCLGSSVALNSVFEGETTDYFWFYSTDQVNFVLFSGESANELSFNTDRFASGTEDETSIYFKVGVVDNICSALSDPFQLDILNRPVVEIRNSLTNESDDVFYCNESELGFSLEAFQVSTNLNLTYEWSRLNPMFDSFELLLNGDQKSYFPLSPGRYRCTVSTLGSECRTTSNEIDVITLPDSVTGSETFCLGTPIDLVIDQDFLPTNIFESFSVQWFFSSDNSPFTLLEDQNGTSISISPESPFYGSGYYSFEISYQNCSKSSLAFFVTEDEDSFTVGISGEQNQFRGIPFELVAVSDDQNVTLFAWEPESFLINENLNRAIVVIPESYEEDQVLLTVLATSENECTASQTIIITLSDVEKAVFSKFITPNGDGLNDVFTITGIEDDVQSELRVFDNWGNTVYQTENYNDNQETKSRELINNVKDGVYYYLFTVNGNSQKGSFYVQK